MRPYQLHQTMTNWSNTPCRDSAKMQKGRVPPNMNMHPGNRNVFDHEMPRMPSREKEALVIASSKYIHPICGPGLDLLLVGW